MTPHLGAAQFIIDTNVISEVMRADADREVVLWFDRVGFSKLAVASPTIMEVRYGIEQMPVGPRRKLREARFAELIDVFLDGRVIGYGREESGECARIMAKKRALGESLDDHLADAMIAACAVTAGLSVATRNESEFRNTGVKTVNPWRAKR